MLYLYTGTDSDTVREKLSFATAKAVKKARMIRITDAHSVADLQAALSGGGMFAEAKIVVLDNVMENEELQITINERLPHISKSDDIVFMYEATPDAATRKLLEKYAEKSERYDLKKEAKKENIFALANYLQQGKKRELWVTYRREITAGKAPEAIHGMLFYGAKQSLLRNPEDERAKKLVAELAELPHESRRAGFDFEYALEYFMLSQV
ncbi:hypothetical protein HY970_00995 [Candidatus Kaiserbacteria bacterium]|nr:hypothetical protein [Candidatus Kaiserbacteria bacterium]